MDALAIDATLCARFMRLPTAVVSDVLSAMGFSDQVLSARLRWVGAPQSFAGPALCLKGSEGQEPPAPEQGWRNS